MIQRLINSKDILDRKIKEAERRRIADYRADDKHDPEYYARLTVEKAQAEVVARPTPNSADSPTNRENDHEPSL